MLLADFKKAKIEAMKQKNADAVSALNVVITKLMAISIEKRAVGQELTEADSSSVLQKAINELKEEKSAFEKAGRMETVGGLQNQIDAIECYLPKLMSEEEIETIINGLDEKTVPFVMKHFKANYAGLVDMKVVGKVLNSLK